MAVFHPAASLSEEIQYIEQFFRERARNSELPAGEEDICYNGYFRDEESEVR